MASKKGDNWIEPTIKYTANDIAFGSDDMPGSIRANSDISGASFTSFLTYSEKWVNLEEWQQNEFERGLPVQRTPASTPGINGYLENDKSYSAGGRSLARATVRSYR